MLTVTYDPNYMHGVSDGRVKEAVDNMLGFEAGHITTGNESVVDELRLRVCKGEISHEDIIFRFDGKDLSIDKDGRFTGKIPKGFCDTSIDVLEGLLWGMGKE